MNFGEKETPFSLVEVSRSGASADTSTVCCTSPTSRLTFMSMRWAIRISMFCRFNFLNPAFSTLTLYTDTGMVGNTYRPASVDVASSLDPVIALVATILAPGTTAPFGSVIVPASEPVAVCDNAATLLNSTIPTNEVIIFRVISPLRFLVVKSMIFHILALPGEISQRSITKQ